MRNVKRNWLVSSKLTWGIWRILSRALKNLKHLHFNGLILTKVYNVSAKKIPRSYVWLHSRLIQSLKENWLVLPKIDMRNLANFHQSTCLESLWLGTLMASFCLELKMYELKIYRGVGVMTMKNDPKLEKKLTCQFKTDMRSFTNFDASTWNSQKFALTSSFWPKYVLS